MYGVPATARRGQQTAYQSQATEAGRERPDVDLLADELFCMAHEEHTGKPLLHKRATELGLAGALISELVLTDNVRVSSGAVTIVAGHHPGDELSMEVLYQLYAERQHQALRTWLAFLAQGALERVAGRLARAGQVYEKRARLSSKVRYVPTNSNRAAWPGVRLNRSVKRGDLLPMFDATLAGLAVAVGLKKHVWWDINPATEQHLKAALASLPISLRETIAHTEAVVGDSVLSPHS
jgi:hypothetical protein